MSATNPHAENTLITASTNAPALWKAPSHPFRGSAESTKTRSETHIRHSRARRKRKRLPSNGSIETDAAIRRRTFRPGSLRRVTSDRVLTFERSRLRGGRFACAKDAALSATE